MKKIVFTLFLWGMTSLLLGQDAVEAAVEMYKKQPPVNAVRLTLPGNYKNVSSVLYEKFRTATKSKGRTEKGLTVFTGVVFPEISNKTMDYYYRVDRAAKKDEANSTITMFVSLGNGNFIKSDKYPTEVAKTKAMLEQMKRATKILEMEIALKTQHSVVKDSEKKLSDIQAQQTALEKKIEEIKAEIEKNKKSQADQKTIIDAEKEKATRLDAEIQVLKSLQ